MTSPLEMARLECANHVGSGCFNERPCLLAQRGVRCSYFESAVLPLSKRKAAYADVPKHYWARAKVDGMREDAAERVCACGNALADRERVCERCKIRRRRESYRAYKRKVRCPQLRAKSSSQVLGAQGRPKPEKRGRLVDHQNAQTGLNCGHVGCSPSTEKSRWKDVRGQCNEQTLLRTAAAHHWPGGDSISSMEGHIEGGDLT